MAELDKITKQRNIIYVVMFICVIGIVVTSGYLLFDKEQYRVAEESYEYLQQQYISVQDPTEDPVPDIPLEKAEDIWLNIDFAALQKVNIDSVAWIVLPDSPINYPVVQTSNNEYYMDHLSNHTKNKAGSIYLDYRNDPLFNDKNTIIYGHNMRDGSMLAAITRYKDPYYYKRYPTMQLYTPGGNYIVEWFAGKVVDGSSEAVRLNFTDDEDFAQYVGDLIKGSNFHTDIKLNINDRIVTLATCSYEFNNARYAIFGRLSDIMENTDNDS